MEMCLWKAVLILRLSKNPPPFPHPVTNYIIVLWYRCLKPYHLTHDCGKIEPISPSQGQHPWRNQMGGHGRWRDQPCVYSSVGLAGISLRPRHCCRQVLASWLWSVNTIFTQAESYLKKCGFWFKIQNDGIVPNFCPRALASSTNSFRHFCPGIVIW